MRRKHYSPFVIQCYTFIHRVTDWVHTHKLRLNFARLYIFNIDNKRYLTDARVLKSSICQSQTFTFIQSESALQLKPVDNKFCALFRWSGNTASGSSCWIFANVIFFHCCEDHKYWYTATILGRILEMISEISLTSVLGKLLSCNNLHL